MLRKESKFILFIALLLLGIVASAQFKSILSVNRQKALAAVDIDKIKAELNREIETQNKLNEELDAKIQEKDALIKTAAGYSNNSSLAKQLEQYNLMAGLTDVKGPGMVVKLNDAPPNKNIDPNLLIIHYMDILDVINELRIDGAQALAINDERVISTSEQICAGPTILINKRRYAVPYEIKVIGNTDSLYKSFMKSDIVSDLEGRSIKVEVKVSKEITIPKYRGNIDFLISGLEVDKK